LLSQRRTADLYKRSHWFEFYQCVPFFFDIFLQRFCKLPSSASTSTSTLIEG